MNQNHEAEAQLTQERIELNAVEQKLKLLIEKKISGRPETTLSFRSTQLAAMWLGKAKGALKLKTPYGESLDPNSKVIETRADVAVSVILNAEYDEVAHIKSLRADLKRLEGAIDNDMLILTDNKRYQACIINAWTNCCNATMWLGMVLNAIKFDAERPADAKPSTANRPGRKPSKKPQEKSDTVSTATTGTGPQGTAADAVAGQKGGIKSSAVTKGTNKEVKEEKHGNGEKAN